MLLFSLKFEDRTAELQAEKQQEHKSDQAENNSNSYDNREIVFPKTSHSVCAHSIDAASVSALLVDIAVGSVLKLRQHFVHVAGVESCAIVSVATV